jgi:hypothetical protein
MKDLIIKGLLFLSVVLLSSCSLRKLPQAYRTPKGGEYVEVKASIKTDSELMAGIRSIAILPFVDSTSGIDNTLDNNDLLTVAERFANHLVGSKTFTSVMYPQQALERLIATPFNVNRKDDLKEIGNLLNVDAILFGRLNQYKMYYPPQLSISMKFYLTRMDRFASALEISGLARSGTPLNNYNPTFFKQLWDTSAFYDGSNKSVLEKLKFYGKTHGSEFYGYSADRVLRTKNDLFNFISYDLSNSLNSEKKVEDNMKLGKKGHKGKNKPRLPSGYYRR